jgi:hypothetical protein
MFARGCFALIPISVIVGACGCGLDQPEHAGAGAVELVIRPSSGSARTSKPRGSFILQGLDNEHRERISLGRAAYQKLRVTLPPGSYALRWEEHGASEAASTGQGTGQPAAPSGTSLPRIVLVAPSRLTTINVQTFTHSELAHMHIEPSTARLAAPGAF